MSVFRYIKHYYSVYGQAMLALGHLISPAGHDVIYYHGNALLRLKQDSPPLRPWVGLMEDVILFNDANRYTNLEHLEYRTTENEPST